MEEPRSPGKEGQNPEYTWQPEAEESSFDSWKSKYLFHRSYVFGSAQWTTGTVLFPSKALPEDGTLQTASFYPSVDACQSDIFLTHCFCGRMKPCG